jgi:hypothetical protein
VKRADAGTGHAIPDDVGRVDYDLEHNLIRAVNDDP